MQKHYYRFGQSVDNGFMKTKWILNRYYQIVKNYRKLFYLAVLLSSLKGAYGIVFPWVMKVLIDTYTLEKPVNFLSQLKFVFIGLFIFYLLLSILVYFQSYLPTTLALRVTFDLRTRLYRQFQRLSANYFNQGRSGDVVSRVLNDVNSAHAILAGPLTALATDLFVFFPVLFLLFHLNVQLTLIALSFSLINGLVFRYTLPRVTKQGRLAQSSYSAVTSSLMERVVGIKVIQSFQMEDYEEKNFRSYLDAHYGAWYEMSHLRGLQQAIGEILPQLSALTVLCLGMVYVHQGLLTTGAIVAFISYLHHLNSPIYRLNMILDQFAAALGGLERVFEFFEIQPEVVDRSKTKSLHQPRGRIEFRDVGFRYQNAKSDFTLQNISFKVEPGQSLALVGPSGAGKSTLVDLLPRFYDVHQGQILLDGEDIRDYQLATLRRAIGTVMQESIIFSGTVRENLLYGKQGASEQEMREALSAANADEFVNKLERGIHTLVGERGVTLSGGQKQRLSIARVFLKNPKILILDEATASLDSQSENLIQEALHRLMADRTTIIIAHRLSTILNVNQIAVLQQGKVVETGTHRELLDRNGLYTQLFNEQFKKVVGNQD